jgi:copper resistance protein D
MDSSLGLGMSVLATALFDWSLALATGSLLAAYWLRPWLATGELRSVRVPRVRTAALLMAIALCAQFYMMVATMTGEAGLAAVLGSAPLVAGTHAGKVALATLGVAVLLWVVPLRRPWVSAALVALILMLHSATGHAAVNGDFSGAEVLQWLHLSGMALWTGGVIVSGFFLVPRLAAVGESVEAGYLRAYLGALSRVSTYAVAVVLLSGGFKGWSGLNHQLHGLIDTVWGRILLGKLVLVVGALALGWLHRRWIRAWTPQQSKMLGATLRVEAVVLTLVMVVSAWLASVDPGGS